MVFCFGQKSSLKLSIVKILNGVGKKNLTVGNSYDAA